MTTEEHTRLESIDVVLRSDTVREQIRPIIERVRAELARKSEALMSWEPIPLTVFGGALPHEIQSSWVFVLRAGADTGAERHPNSHQRMMSFAGSGDMRIADGDSHIESQEERPKSEVDGQASESGIRWKSNLLVSDPKAPLEQRWI